jgi:Ca-activated chloride channel family protein
MRTGLPKTRKRFVGKAIGFALLLLMALVVYAGYSAQPPGQGQDPGSFRLSVDVALVVLHATVTDRAGSVVTDLREADFDVLENGVRQHIQIFKNEDVPITVGLIIDHSTTMRPKMTEVTAAARTFAQASNSEDELFVVNFNEIASLGLPAGIRFTHDIGVLQSAIMTAPTGGQTALYDALAMGLGELQAGSCDKKVLLVVSDGGDNASRRSLEQVMKLAGQSSAVIYSIGLFDQEDPDRNPGVLRRLSKATGGEVFLPEQFSEVVAICEGIARDIRHQYTIGYLPSNPARDGSYRAIRLMAHTKGRDRLSVRTRSGYIAGGETRPADKAGK